MKGEIDEKVNKEGETKLISFKKSTDEANQLFSRIRTEECYGV